MPTVYLDWAATAPPDNSACMRGLETALDAWANPSSPHSAGRKARELLEDARAGIARSLGSQAKSLFFCSGGTEANHIVLSSALTRKNVRILCTAVEHPSVHETVQALSRAGTPVKVIPVDALGRVDPERVVRSLEAGSSILSIVAVNNETGVIQDLAGIVRAIRSVQGGERVHIHADAVQAIGKIHFQPEAMGLDSCSFSAHKLGGPRGWGFLWAARKPEAFLRGGGQEEGLRPGTENLAGALASRIVIEKALADLEANLSHARSLEAGFFKLLASLPGASVIPAGRKPGDSRFSPWIIQAALPSLPGEVVVRILDDAGIALSTGSACSSSRRDRRVLEAMGIEAGLSQRAFRVSFGPATTLADLESLGRALQKAAKGALNG